MKGTLCILAILPCGRNSAASEYSNWSVSKSTAVPVRFMFSRAVRSLMLGFAICWVLFATLYAVAKVATTPTTVSLSPSRAVTIHTYLPFSLDNFRSRYF